MNVSNRQVVAGLVLGILVLTAGCSGGAQLGGGGDAGAESAALTGDAGEAEAEAAEKGDGGAGGGVPQARQQAIIRTGQVDLRVEDFDAARRNLTTTVQRLGGFVSDSRVDVSRVDNSTYETGRIVVRVPRENFSRMMTRARAAGEVRSVQTNSEDVGEQLVDLSARLENLRAERDRLRQLYRNASDTEDVLAVEERLSDVQGEIERIEARKQSLERQVALSTIRIELREPRPEPGPIDPDRWFDTPVLVAFLESVNGVITSLRAVVVATAFALPYAVVYGPPVAGVAYAVYRWRRGRGDRRGEVADEPAVDPEGSTGTSDGESGSESESESESGDAGPDEASGDGT